MPPFMLQVRDDTNWRVLDEFQERNAALARAEQVKSSSSCTGIKVLEKVIDADTMGTRQKVVFAWTTKTHSDQKQEDVENYMGRRKVARTEKERREDLERELKRARLRNFALATALFVGFALAAAGLVYLKTS